MSATPTNEEEVEVPSEEGVGQHLRRVREALDLSRGEVAAGLYLKEDIIRALEEDDKDALPGPVFVQGYIRKYARLLNIPEEALLEEYNQQIAPHKRHKKREGPLAGSPIKPEISSKHAIVRLITWAIVLGLLALLVMWWQGDMRWSMGQLDEEQPVSQDIKPESSLNQAEAQLDTVPLSDERREKVDAEEPIARDQMEASEAEAQPERVTLNLQQTESDQAENAVDEPLAEVIENKPADESTTLASETAGDVAETEATAIDENTSDQTLAQPEETSEISATTDASSVNEAEPVPSEPIDYANNIVIEFSEACWTEVRGANDSYKLIGNMQEGEHRVLGGEPPYTFLLGNSHGVTLTIKGQKFDIEAHSKANIARFTLQAEDIPDL